MCRHRYPALIAIGLAWAGCARGEQPQPHTLTPRDDGAFSEIPAPNATEERATSLDGLPPIDGVTAVDSATALLWSTMDKSVWLLHGASLQQFDLGQTTPAAVEQVSDHPTTLRIIDAGKAKAITIHLPGGRVLLEESLEVGDSIIAAAAFSGATYLIRKPTSGSPYLTVNYTNRSDKSVTPLQQLRPLAFSGSPALISVSGRGALVTYRGWPFHIWAVRPDSFAVRQLAPLSESWVGDSLAAHGRSNMWVAGPALHLDNGVLLGLTHLTTDAKASIVLDNEGRVVRLRFSQLPMGLVASEPGSRRLFAIRYAGPAEFVRYRY